MKVIKSNYSIFLHVLRQSVKATVPTDTQLRIPEDTNSVSDELLMTAANAIDSSSVLPKTTAEPPTEEKQVGDLKVNILKPLSLKELLSTYSSNFSLSFSLIIYINAPINIMPAGGEAGHRVGI